MISISRHSLRPSSIIGPEGIGFGFTRWLRYFLEKVAIL